jgi:hypothetical protein
MDTKFNKTNILIITYFTDGLLKILLPIIIIINTIIIIIFCTKSVKCIHKGQLCLFTRPNLRLPKLNC